MVALLVIAAGYATVPSALVVTVPADAQSSPHLVKSDFIIFYTAGHIAITYKPDRIYDLQLQQKNQAEAIGISNYVVTPYFYPPQSILFFAPLAYFPITIANHIWHALNTLFTFFLLIALYSAGICKKPGTLLVATLLLLSSGIWIGVIANGQPTILMTLGIFGCQLLAKYKYSVLAGLLLVITAFKPQLICAPTLYLLIIYGRSLWISIGCIAAVVIGICSAIFGLSIWHIYSDTLSMAPDLLRVENIIMEMSNFRTLILFVFGQEYFNLVNTLVISLWVGTIGIAAWIAFFVRYKSEKEKELGFALVVAMTCFFSPYLYSNSLIILLISIGYLMKYTGLRGLYPIIIGLMAINWAERTFPFNFDPVLWLPAQIFLIAWIGYYFLQQSASASRAADS